MTRSTPLSAEQIRAYAKEVEPLTLGLNLLSDHAIIADRDMHIVYMNDAAERVTGYSREEALGRRPGDLWGGNMPPSYYDHMKRILYDKKSMFVGEVLNTHKSGYKFWQEVRISPVLDAAGEVRFLIAIEPEISKRKEREELLAGFGSTVSHQLKNMLNTTGLLASLLQTSSHLDEQEHRYAEMILRSNRDMAVFINDLMELSRSQEASTDMLEPFDLRGKIERIVSSQRNLHPHVSFDVEYPGQPVLLRVSRSLAYQVFINVIANAAEYSNPADGRVIIRISAADGQFTFTCADNGIGIPDEDQPKIFGQFFRAGNAKGRKESGTGLGLAIVKMICDKVGWSVSFTSSPGLGTTFTIVGACAAEAPGKA